jgi:integrase
VRFRILIPAGEAIGIRVTPHMLRRTFASILAEIGISPRRTMYLLGHADPTLTMAVYQQVLDVSAETEKELEQLLGCPLDEGFSLLAAGGFGHE